MGSIAAIVQIASNRAKAKEIACRVQMKRELNQDSRAFGDILNEEIDKLYKEKAIKDDRQEILDSKENQSRIL
ncbi:hypothetical protein [Clostridium saccharobutylicum]|uniref:Uncharacterized protein n=1 Tax=Clostridium saccharobutylicum DSM 13864 TaxID=1345695 RepID=U5MTY9_CLOSA|nr:hypothetical protein [Clostridium saccharobutylicum]AGX43988.1 hypothetical protein CLSA_c30210 [Clostridium saccharobutylicum DSM 13864]AQR91284.1 hypothetical protein CLOSC_30080 [Clostridium saccharobutylicum]AQS01188.1 hypothetical protein CSACC_30150 [Clostridium saccharobutylicum]AQS15171.1 hypothetical protein CLOSACC_30150 [Clostridium saccharobutylicum]MBA2905298.1 hypothetical protein [Clostridium saccharobutylicum]